MSDQPTETVQEVKEQAAPNLPAPPATESKALEELKTLHQQHLEVESAYEKELKALKTKYSQKYNPLYERRVEVLRGTEVKPDEETGTPGIKAFWLTAFKSNDDLSILIKAHDEPILEHLTNVRSEWHDEAQQTDFKVILEFGQNSYFTNTVLEKSFIWNSERDLAKTVGTKINWKEGKDVTKQTVTKRQKNKKTKQVRTVTEVVANESFFNFFEDRDIPTGDQLEEMDEDDVETLETTVKLEFEAGEALRDRIIPRAVGWYLGEEQNFGDSDEDYDDDDTSEEDSDNDNDDDDDDDEDEPADKSKKSKDEQCKTQ